ncbi:MAG: histidinol-phosphate transaminase [Lachnospiraceae bacterium]|nr:histidinol-phosphate transaminase [Lachnospiraceae bacterium]
MSAWEDNIRKVVPYVPGEQPKVDNIIKLNTNENPYGPSPRVEKIAMDMEKLKLYPDPAASALVDAIANYHEVSSDKVFVGVGSDDVLAMSFLTFFNSGKEILFPDITYSFYDVWAELYKIPYKAVPVDDDFRIIKEDYHGENGGVIFPNPNAPTSIAEPLSFVEDIVKNNQDVVVIVDEAYVDFGGETALPLVDKYENLLVVRTFSKSRSMAGLRIGYAIGNPKLIKYLSDVKYSFNSYTMNMPSIIYGVESIADDDYFKETVAKVVDTREWFKSEIEKLGFACPPSSANFLFMTHESIPAKEIFEKAREAKIIVRYFNKPRIDNYLRVTIGTRKEMESFLSFLKKLVKDN